ncbi:MAG: hypothetical protein ABSH48_23755 [Verrucomicrobiota bacterium]
MKLSATSNRVQRIAKHITLGLSLAAALDLAATACAQTYPTNFINFASLAAQSPASIYGDYTNITPNGISMFLGWQIDSEVDVPAPSGSTVSISCEPGVSITFSAPVLIQSVAAYGGGAVEIVGKNGGAQVWVYQGSGAAAWTTVTNGANLPVTELDFPAAWNARYTDFYIQDAEAVAAPLLGAFGVSPDAKLRVNGAPVQLNWIVAPTADVTIDNGIGDVTADTINGTGFYAVDPTNTTTYTLTAEDGTNVATAKVTVTGSFLPSTVGFMTFEDLVNGTLGTSLNQLYSWNTPAGVYTTWTGWNDLGGNVGAPATPVVVFPTQWSLTSTNSTGATNNATVAFTDDTGLNPVPVMVNSFAVAIDTNAVTATNWGPIHVEGLLAGVVQWTFDEYEAVEGENIVTKGAGLPIDTMYCSGMFYQYDNFALSTVKLPDAVSYAPAVQNGQFQFSWNSVANWPDYVIDQEVSLGNGWTRIGLVSPTPAGTTNTYSEPVNNSSAFYRVLRVP